LVTVAAPGLVIGEEQYNAGAGQSGPPSPIDCVSGDLLEMSGVVAANELNALWRSGIYNDGVAYYGDNSTAVLTYTLDLASTPAGYDIQEIRAFSGWDSYRSGQSYDVSYSLVGAPDTFVALGTILTGERNGAVMTRTYHTGGVAILSGVAKIRFNIQPTNGGGGTFPPGEGYGTVWREFDVIGSATGSGAPTYASWATTNGVSNNPNEDSNNDGVQNGIAYFMDATGLATNPGITGNTVTWPNGGNIPATEYGTQFVVQTSTDLVNWTPVGVGGPGLSNTAGSVTYTLPPDEPGGKLFVRLVVTPD
jgi:hypothetical protein